MKDKMILKLIGITISTTVVLVGLSIVEVFVYSIAINPDQATSVYDAHADVSAPWVSAIGGFIIFFLMIRYWSEKNRDIIGKLAFLYPLTYTIWDLLILLMIGIDWSEFYLVFILSQLAKYAGSYLGYFTVIKKQNAV